MPSVYGDSKLVFHGDNPKHVRVVSRDSYYGAIMEMIKRADMTPVLVFFETRKELEDFRHSTQFSRISGAEKLLTEKTSAKDRRDTIASAAAHGQLTLCTKEFGRGTDFLCFDKNVNEDGGVSPAPVNC